MGKIPKEGRTVLVAFWLLVAGIACAGAVLSLHTEPDLYISEVCPHNDGVIHDSVGFYCDFIVLTNASDHDINLRGYSLSDNSTELRRFTFTDAVIASGEDMTVFAGDRQTFGDDYTDDDAIYTGFGIKDHEYVFLTDPNGVVADSLRIPKMDRDRTLLRDDPGDRGAVGYSKFMADVPPVVSDKAAPPDLSEGSGFYQDPFELTLSGSPEVYYTTDGTNPYTSGILYKDPIEISDRSTEPDLYTGLGPLSAAYDGYIPSEPVSKATIIRAVSKLSDGSYSKESTAVYYVGDKVRNICSGTYTVSIVTDPDGLFSEDRGIYVTGDTWEANRDKVTKSGADPVYAPANYNMRGKGWRRNARLTLFDPDGKCLYEEDDLISIRGKSSRSVIQKGLNIRSADGVSKVFEGLLPGEGDVLMLRTGSAEDVFKTNFRDSINARIAKDMKIASQQSLCCQMYLNGEYWGCYNMQEHLDTGFIANRYGVDAANINLIKLEGDPEVPSHLTSDLNMYQELEHFVMENDLANEDDYERFCGMVDMDSLIDFYCAQIFFANDDAYLGNVALWRVRDTGDGPYEDGKWRYLLYDLDNSDAYAENAGAGIDSFVEGSYADYNADDDLYFSALSQNEEFRRRFAERFEELLADDFSYEKTGPVVDEYESRYVKAMVNSIRRFNDEDFTEADYRENVRVVRDFFKDRGGYMSEYVKLHMGE